LCVKCEWNDVGPFVVRLKSASDQLRGKFTFHTLLIKQFENQGKSHFDMRETDIKMVDSFPFFVSV